jgi:hypothetical protein
VILCIGASAQAQGKAGVAQLCFFLWALKEEAHVVFPTRVRRGALQHAFEAALEAASEDGVQLELDGLDGFSGQGDDEAARRIQVALEGLNSLAGSRSVVADKSLANAYDVEADPQESSRLARPQYAAERTIALVKDASSERDLARLRRRFAAQNHPDRVPLSLREEAERAMALVNAEVDAALKRLATKRS